MAEQFYTILTLVGKAKIANANVLGNKVNFVKLKIGDGGGSYYNPIESQTDIKNKVWEGSINSISIDENNPNWIVIETILPGTVGGFTIREAGIFDDENNLIAIGKYPETYKPIASEGSSKDLIMRMILEVSNAESVTLKIDPTVILATKKDIEVLESKMADLTNKFNLHLSDNKSHIPYGVATGSANTYAVTLSPVPTSYVDGMALCVKINVASTGASTLNVNELGAKQILDSLGNPITAGGLKAGLPYTMRYNGTNFIVQGKGGGGNLVASDLLLGKKGTGDNGLVVGTMPNNGALGATLPINGTYTIPAGYTSGGTVTQNIPTKAAATINPSTVAQTIAAGQYLSGLQTIAAVTGTATDPDVVAGKTYNSAAGILRTGTASIASLGGKRYASGTIDSYKIGNYDYATISGFSFYPSVILIYYSGYFTLTMNFGNGLKTVFSGISYNGSGLSATIGGNCWDVVSIGVGSITVKTPGAGNFNYIIFE